MKTGTIIEARASSTRLPKKILKELPYRSGINVLEQVIKSKGDPFFSLQYLNVLSKFWGPLYEI